MEKWQVLPKPFYLLDLGQIRNAMYSKKVHINNMIPLPYLLYGVGKDI